MLTFTKDIADNLKRLDMGAFKTIKNLDMRVF